MGNYIVLLILISDAPISNFLKYFEFWVDIFIMLKTSDLDYTLPPERIAQEPAALRAQSRLMVLGKPPEGIRHLTFSDFPDLLRRDDLLVLNDTEVFPARLMAVRQSGGRVEILLLGYPSGDSEVPCMARPGRKIKDGDVLTLEDGTRLKMRKDRDNLWARPQEGDFLELIMKVGKTPLPPYIERAGSERGEMDRERYQTVYARRPGAVAAPTAGLHFDEGVLHRIRDSGARIENVTLHVGPGTFQPVRTENIADHRMEQEPCHIPQATAEAVDETRDRGGRVVAVGTTVVRTLESAMTPDGMVPGHGTTDLFISPGYRFQVVDALLTNFHLPRSTLLMLVCAFGGVERILAAYREAVEAGYRFYSYGDCMFIE